MTQSVSPLGLPIGDRVVDWTPPQPPSRASLDGRYCRLEPVDPKRHGSDLYQANATDTEGRIWTYLPYGPFATLADYQEWLESVSRPQDPLFHAIVDLDSGRAVGVASYLRIQPGHGSIEVGHINFAPSLQRKPAATEAMYLLMKRAFEAGYRRYEWKCDALNQRSRAAAQRLGLSFEGIFRQATVYKGRNRDTAWYAAIDSEWPALSQAFEHWLNPANFSADGQQRVRLSELTSRILVARG